MKLYINKASPFARKARILAREAGIADRIEEIDTVVSPVTMNKALARENPLIKIPALVTDSGETFYDSPVICEYLDTLHQKPKFFPEPGPRRFAALRWQALTDGMMDAAVLSRYEMAVRPEALRWKDWTPPGSSAPRAASPSPPPCRRRSRLSPTLKSASNHRETQMNTDEILC